MGACEVPVVTECTYTLTNWLESCAVAAPSEGCAAIYLI